jgi:uncharacterized integral membrane protein
MQQQQSANYDLLAFFPDEIKASEATDKLHQAGFSEDEVQQLASGTIGSRQFREHGPDRSRGEYFLRKERSAPNPVLVILLGLVFALVLGALAFVSTFIVPPFYSLPIGYVFLVGAIIGFLIGVAIALIRRGRMRGDIGQATVVPPPRLNQQCARTVIALRFADPGNVSRKSRARAIVINNQGKIDRSVGRQE